MLVEKFNKKIKGDNELDANLYIPDGNKQYPGVLMSHGFLSAKEEFGDLPEQIASQGYVVLTFDFSGHGKSNGDRGYINLNSHLKDAESALKFLLEQIKVIPETFVVIGHSLGTVATSRLITESEIGKKCKSCILMSPPKKLQDSISKLELNAYTFLANITFPFFLFTGKHIYLPYQFSAKDIYLNKDAIKKAKDLDFLQNKMPVTNHSYMITQIDNERFASQIKAPTLVIVAKDDKLVPNKGSKIVFEAITASPKKYIEIDNTGHSMMMDNNSEQVKNEIVNWLKETT